MPKSVSPSRDSKVGASDARTPPTGRGASKLATANGRGDHGPRDRGNKPQKEGRGGRTAGGPPPSAAHDYRSCNHAACAEGCAEKGKTCSLQNRYHFIVSGARRRIDQGKQGEPKPASSGKPEEKRSYQRCNAKETACCTSCKDGEHYHCAVDFKPGCMMHSRSLCKACQGFDADPLDPHGHDNPLRDALGFYHAALEAASDEDMIEMIHQRRDSRLEDDYPGSIWEDDEGRVPPVNPNGAGSSRDALESAPLPVTVVKNEVVISLPKNRREKEQPAAITVSSPQRKVPVLAPPVAIPLPPPETPKPEEASVVVVHNQAEIAEVVTVILTEVHEIKEDVLPAALSSPGEHFIASVLDQELTPLEAPTAPVASEPSGSSVPTPRNTVQRAVLLHSVDTAPWHVRLVKKLAKPFATQNRLAASLQLKGVKHPLFDNLTLAGDTILDTPVLRVTEKHVGELNYIESLGFHSYSECEIFLPLLHALVTDRHASAVAHVTLDGKYNGRARDMVSGYAKELCVGEKKSFAALIAECTVEGVLDEKRYCCLFDDTISYFCNVGLLRHARSASTTPTGEFKVTASNFRHGSGHTASIAWTPHGWCLPEPLTMLLIFIMVVSFVSKVRNTGAMTYLASPQILCALMGVIALCSVLLCPQILVYMLIVMRTAYTVLNDYLKRALVWLMINAYARINAFSLRRTLNSLRILEVPLIHCQRVLINGLTRMWRSGYPCRMRNEHFV